MQRAIAAAKTAVDDTNLPYATCEVWVANGTYYAYGSGRSDSITMQKNVAMYGGFAGSELSRTARDPNTNVSVLSARSSELGTDRVYHVVTGASDSLLDGFTIEGGKADGSAELGKGGGVYASGQSPVIRNVKLENNSAQYGGAMYFENSTPTVTGCEFRANSATVWGGAIHAVASQLQLEQSYFAQNSAAMGGALSFDGVSTSKVVSCAFWSNTATQYGGGAVGQGSADTTYWNCSFVDDTAPTGGPDVAVSASAKKTFFSSILQGPDSISDRWAFIANGGTIAMTRCISSKYQTSIGSYTTTDAIMGTATFVNRASGDLHLAAGSLGIDASYSSASTPTVDLEGTPAQGVRDVGAYEYSK